MPFGRAAGVSIRRAGRAKAGRATRPRADAAARRTDLDSEERFVKYMITHPPSDANFGHAKTAAGACAAPAARWSVRRAGRSAPPPPSCSKTERKL